MPRLRVYVIVLLLVFVGFVQSANAEGASVTLEANTYTVNTGDEFTVSVKANDVNDLAGVTFEVQFDPSVLQVVPFADGQALEEGDIFSSFTNRRDFVNTVDNVAGVVSFTASLTDPHEALFSGSGTLAIIRFRTLAEGSTRINFKQNSDMAAGGLVLGTMGGAEIEATTQPIDITVRDYVPVASVALDSNVLALAVGDSQQLTATIAPVNASNQVVDWCSNDENVATVVDGLVTATGSGATTIRAVSADGPQAVCTVTVEVPVTDVSLSKHSVAMAVGDSTTLTATIAPVNATNTGVTWASSNSDIVSVTDGVLEAHKPGEATITVETDDGGYSDSCTVTVGASFSGSIVLDGQGDNSGIVVQALNNNEQVAGEATTDEDGSFTLWVPAGGTYRIVVAHPGWSYLEMVDSVELGAIRVLSGQTLFFGDMNHDSYINVLDILWMADSIGIQLGEEGFKELADVNCDNVVDILDLLEVAVNIGKRP